MPIDRHESGKVGARWHRSTGGKQTTLVLQKEKKKPQPANVGPIFVLIFLGEQELKDKNWYKSKLLITFK